MVISVILGVIAALFVASFVVDRRRRRRHSDRFVARAERGIGVDGSSSIAASDARAIQGNLGRTN